VRNNGLAYGQLGRNVQENRGKAKSSINYKASPEIEKSQKNELNQRLH